MSFSPPSTQFTISGITSFKPDERVRHEAAEETAAKNGWKTGLFYYGEGRTTPFFVARAAKERGTIAGLPGMNVMDVLDEADVHEVNRRGYTAIWTPLPEAVRGRPIDMEAVRRVIAFLTSPASPVHTLSDKTKPLYIGTHSTSGRIVHGLQSNQATSDILARSFHGIVSVNPFIDSSGSSELFDPINNRIFLNYARKHHDQTPHETLFGRGYMFLKAAKEGYAGFEKQIKSPADEPLPQAAERAYLGMIKRPLSALFAQQSEHSMTYGHILELLMPGRSLRQTFNAECAKRIPTVFVLSEYDPFSCRRTTDQAIAKKMGARVITAKSELHYPFRHDRGALLEALETLDYWTDRFEARQRETIYISPAEFLSARPTNTESPQKTGAKDNIPALTLGDRLGLALQRGAGLLNPAASLF